MQPQDNISQRIHERALLLKDMVEQIVQSPMHDFSNSKAVPPTKGIYIIYDKSKGIIYVGQSGNLRRRLFGEHLSGNVNGSHFRKSLQNYLGSATEDEISRYVANQCTFQFLATEEHRYLEHFAIAVLKPVLNR